MSETASPMMDTAGPMDIGPMDIGRVDIGLVDIGINLTASAFKADLAQVIERAQAAHVAQMVITGTDLKHSEAAIELCEQGVAGNRFSGLYSTAGVHPHHASQWESKSAQHIEQMAGQACVRALGECGLDYNRNFSTPKEQRLCFEAQLELAVELQLPVFLHQRDAHGDFLKIIQRWADQLVGGVAHCFTGNLAQAQAYLELGLEIGVTGWICDERRGHDLRQAVAEIPLQRIMLETDAPYLLPRDLSEAQLKPLQPRRNEPWLLGHVCGAVARQKDLTYQEVADQTTKLARNFFGLED